MNDLAINHSLLDQDESYSLSRRTSSRKKRLIWDVAESIDYHPFNNTIKLENQATFKQQMHRRSLFGFSGSTVTALLLTMISGFFIGITARLMEMGMDIGVEYRNDLLEYFLLKKCNLPTAVMYFLAFCSTLTVLSAAAVQFFAPGAAGAGVSLVMAFLNGNDLTGLFTPAVFITKLLGTICSRTAAMTVGPEAPMIHLGAIVSSLIFGFGRRLRTISLLQSPSFADENAKNNKDSESFFSNSSHRQIVSAGAAAGLAAAFGAPIGGVLFVLEEACSVWSRKIAWRCLLCTTTAVFTVSQLNPSLRGRGILSLRGIYPLSSQQWLAQMPFVVAVSIVAGLLGATFNILRVHVTNWRAARRKHLLRLVEAAAVSAITAAITLGAPLVFGRCLVVEHTWQDKHSIQFTCPKGQYNDLATLLLSSSHYVIRSILGLGSESAPINKICTLNMPCYFSAQALLATVVIYIMCMALVSGLAVPGGLFMPSILAGASSGALAGMILSAILPESWDVQPGVYALIGATAMLAGVFRSSISLVVIMVEATGGLDFIMGILAAVIISNFIAHYFHKDGIYESELERDGRVFFLRQEPPGILRYRTASDIMATSVTGLHRIEDASRIVEVLKSSAHNGFPVYPCSSQGAGAPEDPSIATRLDGFILRSQLLILLQEKAFCDAQGRYLRPPPGDLSAYEQHLEELVQLAIASSDGIVDATETGIDPLGPAENESRDLGVAHTMMQTMETLDTLRSLPSLVNYLPEEQDQPGTPSFLRTPTLQGSSHPGLATPRYSSELFLNLDRFMDRGMLSVRPDTPAQAVHQMFVGLSLRHLCVTDNSSHVVGIITRKDLDNASGHGWWRSNKIAPKPERLDIVSPNHPARWFVSSLQAFAPPFSSIFTGGSTPSSQRVTLGDSSTGTSPFNGPGDLRGEYQESDVKVSVDLDEEDSVKTATGFGSVAF